MRYLYIFPHPDDESFGPAAAMAQQVRTGSEVHLLTLTRGGATKRRFDLGLSIEEMGLTRYREMLDVERVLGLTSMTVLDLPDNGLKELDPRDLEAIVREHILRLRPDVVVSYAVFGVSGFEDHLVTHAIVKRVYVELRDEHSSWLRRLAMFTISADDPIAKSSPIGLRGSRPDEIDCVLTVEPEDLEALHRALDCYVTYQPVIERSKVREIITREVSFEIFGEDHVPPLGSLDEALDGALDGAPHAAPDEALDD
jgi:LmbE family N-acetylglucosaminyl deacetylase